METYLLVTFVVLGVIGCTLFFIRKYRNVSYLFLSLAFLALGSNGAIKGETSSLAAFLLALVAIRKYVAPFEK